MKIGIIGGSGLENPNLIVDAQEMEVETPFGKPSGKVKTGKINDVEVAFISRHGKGHTISPTNVNYRANIWALKETGCTHIIAVTATGSLQEEIKPGEVVFIDQFIDRTTKREQTFYEKGRICHISTAEPFCVKLRERFAESAKELGMKFHAKGTAVTIEGPRFSTKAESHLFRYWKGDVINMTTVPEVVLAREVGICYAAIAVPTDYDCWKESEEKVSMDLILENFAKSIEKVIELIKVVVTKVEDWECSCKEDHKMAMVGHEMSRED